MSKFYYLFTRFHKTFEILTGLLEPRHHVQLKNIHDYFWIRVQIIFN